MNNAAACYYSSSCVNKELLKALQYKSRAIELKNTKPNLQYMVWYYFLQDSECAFHEVQQTK
jgi:hypothetical protein